MIVDRSSAHLRHGKCFESFADNGESPTVKGEERGETPFSLVQIIFFVIFYINIINIIYYICENHFYPTPVPIQYLGAHVYSGISTSDHHLEDHVCVAKHFYVLTISSTN